MSERSYPEHAKLTAKVAVAAASQQVGEWLDDNGYAICRLRCLSCGVTEFDQPVQVARGDDLYLCHHNDPAVQYVRVRGSIRDWLADAFDINLTRLENEKRMMLEYARGITDVDTEVV